MQQISKQPAFELGQIVATPGALAALKKAGFASPEMPGVTMLCTSCASPSDEPSEIFCEISALDCACVAGVHASRRRQPEWNGKRRQHRQAAHPREQREEQQSLVL